MQQRYVTIWFRYLKTDWFTLRQVELRQVPFILAEPDHGRLVVSAANALALAEGIHIGMAVADARAIFPGLQVFDDKQDPEHKLLNKFAEWFIRFTPTVAIDPPDGLTLNVSGCTHLWGSEENYLNDIRNRMQAFGYYTRLAIADTIGAAWAATRFGKQELTIIETGKQTEFLLSLSPAALRIETVTLERLKKLGLYQVRIILSIPRAALRCRFGELLIQQIDFALGQKVEFIKPIIQAEVFSERLPCLEPIATAKGIEIALERLLENLCSRLEAVQKGLRKAILKGYRLDGKIEHVEIGTNRGTHNRKHLFKLFEFKLPGIEPDLGIELFILEAPLVEDVSPTQEQLWDGTGGLADPALAELIDRMINKIGAPQIRRYLPDVHHWPERSVKVATNLLEEPTTPWRTDRPRPVQLLANPEPVTVAAPVPDYPPMLFRYKGKVHKIKKADGPERIEREWWLDEGQHRDYYCVEDEEGLRYWLFRSGHYEADKAHGWFIHGFFA